LKEKRERRKGASAKGCAFPITFKLCLQKEWEKKGRKKERGREMPHGE